jgi:AcrR family transcriptional regulator
LTDGQSKKGVSMPIIVDKEQKRRDIALACRDLLLEEGIENLTVSQIAKRAGVGKGTIYEYFANKEDIVFEIITSFIDEYRKQLEALVDAPMHTHEKLFAFCYALYDSPEGLKHLDIYKEFIAISLTRKDPAMLAFSEQTRSMFRSILEKILEQGVRKGEIEERCVHAAESLIVFSSGLMIESRLHDVDVRRELERFLELLFPNRTSGEAS